MTAIPAEGWTFLGWLGDADSTGSSIQVTMDRDKSVQAIFGTTLHTAAAGPGSILRSPNATLYPYGTTVRLNALPQIGSCFAGWANAATGDANPFELQITEANPNVTAAFTALPIGYVSLGLVVSGRGTVTVNPAANLFPNVTLTATPNSGQAFLGWSGDAVGTATPLLLTLNESEQITARFSARPSLSVEGWWDVLNRAGLRLLLRGDFAARYQIEKSANGTAWSLLTTITNSNGTSQFIDYGATAGSSRLYRAVLVP